MLLPFRIKEQRPQHDTILQRYCQVFSKKKKKRFAKDTHMTQW